MSAPSNPPMTRRNFLQTTAAAGAAAIAVSAPAGARAAASDKVRVAMVGCGHRGTVDAVYCLKSAPGVELYAMADLFRDRIDESMGELKKQVPDKVNVAPDRIFLGFDAYKKVLAMPEVDLVLLLTPPGFRPRQVADAVAAGKEHLHGEARGGRPRRHPFPSRAPPMRPTSWGSRSSSAPSSATPRSTSSSSSGSGTARSASSGR